MRKLLILLALILAVGTSFSQDKEKRLDINKAGFKFDINSSYITLGDLPSDTAYLGLPNEYFAKTGYSFGLFYREALGSIFGGQVEVRYVQMGAYDKRSDIETRLDYLRLGAQFKLYPLTSTLGANAFLGFEYGILIAAEQDDPTDKSKAIDLKDLGIFKPGDFGVHFGVGLDFDFGFTTDLRLYLGLADIREKAPAAHNLSSQLHIGWGF